MKAKIVQKENKAVKKELEKKIKRIVPVVEVKSLPKFPARQQPKTEVNVEEFFVGLHNAMDVRRNMLESSRDMIHTLQSYQKITEIRQEKMKRVAQFKTISEEIKMLVNKLNKSLPKVQVKEIEVRAKETFDKLPKKESRTEFSRTGSEKSDLEKLEEELAKIEGRLSKLG
jgi:hypothetical protein